MSTLAEDLMRAPKLRARPNANYFRQRLRELRAMRKRRAKSPPNRNSSENDNERF